MKEIKHDCTLLNKKLSGNIYDDVYGVYMNMFSKLNKKTPYIAQIWNYLPDIYENYNEFNRARNDAYKSSGYSSVPAGVCVENSLEFSENPTEYFEMCVDFVSVKPIEINNPRQKLPHDYSIKYGNSPMFSRAVVVGNELYISGTASIVGEMTMHSGDFVKQLQETMLNIERVIEEGNKILQTNIHVENLNYVVYLEDLENKQVAMELLTHYYNIKTKIIFKKTRMCRKDLMIEIEAWS